MPKPKLSSTRRLAVKVDQGTSRSPPFQPLPHSRSSSSNRFSKEKISLNAVLKDSVKGRHNRIDFHVCCLWVTPGHPEQSFCSVLSLSWVSSHFPFFLFPQSTFSLLPCLYHLPDEEQSTCSKICKSTDFHLLSQTVKYIDHASTTTVEFPS